MELPFNVRVLKGNFDNGNSEKSITHLTKEFLNHKIDAITASLESNKSDKKKLTEIQEKIALFRKELSILLKETEELQTQKGKKNTFHFPETPISKRELEVLLLIKEGFTNIEIGQTIIHYRKNCKISYYIYIIETQSK